MLKFYYFPCIFVHIRNDLYALCAWRGGGGSYKAVDVSINGPYKKTDQNHFSFGYKITTTTTKISN